MQPELRDKLLARVDELALWAGGTDYDTAMREATCWLGKVLAGMDRLRTREHLKEMFDQMPEPTFVERRLILGTFRYLPQILKYWATQFATAEGLPQLPRGRAGVDLERKAEVVSYVLRLFGQNCSLELAKKRAAARFAVSESTVQRIWDDRGSLDEADFRSALKWISEQQ